MELHADRAEDVCRVQENFRTVYRKLREITYITVQDVDMHHVNIVLDVVLGLQEVL